MKIIIDHRIIEENTKCVCSLGVCEGRCHPKADDLVINVKPSQFSKDDLLEATMSLINEEPMLVLEALVRNIGKERVQEMLNGLRP